MVLPTLGQPQRASPGRVFPAGVLELLQRRTGFKSVLPTGWSVLADSGVTRYVTRPHATLGVLAFVVV